MFIFKLTHKIQIVKFVFVEYYITCVYYMFIIANKIMKKKKKFKKSMTHNKVNRKLLLSIFATVIIVSALIAFVLPKINNQLSVSIGIAEGTRSPDINPDGKVDIFDLSRLLADWGTSIQNDVLTITPSNDAFVDSARPDTVLESAEPNVLQTDQSPSQKDTFMRFKIPDQINGTINKATLKMTVVDDGSEYTSGSVYATSNDNKAGTARWYSNNLTWNNAPPANGGILFTHGPTISGQVAEFDLSNYYTSAGDLKSIRVVGSNPSGTSYSSVESGTPPTLELELSAGASNASDISGDGLVNIYDLSILLSNWGDIPTEPPVTGPTRPDATNTGPKTTQFSLITEKYPTLNGSAYTVNTKGKVTITGSGTVSNYLTFDGVYFPHGAVIKGNYIKITNSKIASGRSTENLPKNPITEAECKAFGGSGWALFTSRSSEITTNPENSLIVEDSEIYIRNDKSRTMDGSANDGNITEVISGKTYNYTNDGPSIGMNAFQGRNATFRRVNVHGGIDSMGFNPRSTSETSGGVVLENSYLHDQFRWPYSQGHGCRDATVYSNNPYSTHSDAIQIHGLGNFVIKNNNIVANPLPVNVEVQESGHASTLSNAYDTYVTSKRTGSDGKIYVRWVPKNNTGIESNGKLQKITIEGNHFEYGTCSINIGVPYNLSTGSGLDQSSAIIKNTFWGKNGSNADRYGSNYPPYTTTNKRSSGACAISNVYFNNFPVNSTDPNVNKWSDGSVALPIWAIQPAISGY
jgi:hypothetical protein